MIFSSVQKVTKVRRKTEHIPKLSFVVICLRYSIKITGTVSSSNQLEHDNYPDPQKKKIDKEIFFISARREISIVEKQNETTSKRKSEHRISIFQIFFPTSKIIRSNRIFYSDGKPVKKFYFRFASSKKTKIRRRFSIFREKNVKKGKFRRSKRKMWFRFSRLGLNWLRRSRQMFVTSEWIRWPLADGLFEVLTKVECRWRKFRKRPSI